MNASASNHIETSVVSSASLVNRHPRCRPASKLIKPTISNGNRCNPVNLDNHHETQTTCPIGATRSRRHHPFSLGDLGHNDCFYRRISSCRRMGDRQKISFRHDLADLLSHNFTTHLLFWDFAGTDRVLGQSGRNPTTPFRLLAGGLGNDGRHGLDHVLHPVGGDFVVSDAHAPAVSSVRRRIKVGHFIHVSAGSTANRLLPTHAPTDALIGSPVKTIAIHTCIGSNP
jgi:hypothetical protein